MRTSLKKTPMAMVRFLTGMKAEEFAEMIGVTVGSLRQYETKPPSVCRLSIALAVRVALETGVEPTYLMQSSVRPLPKTQTQLAFTQLTFEAHRAFMAVCGQPKKSYALSVSQYLVDLVSIASAAAKQQRLMGFQLSVERFIADLKKEFGEDPQDRRNMNLAFLNDDAGIKAMGGRSDDWLPNIMVEQESGTDFRFRSRSYKVTDIDQGEVEIDGKKVRVERTTRGDKNNLLPAMPQNNSKKSGQKKPAQATAPERV